MPIELRAETRSQIEEIAAKYPNRQAALLPVLHLVQREYGHLSIDVQSAVAAALSVPPTLVHEVTTFYEMYHQHAEGQFHLELCTNISCHLAGADSILDHLQKKLGVSIGHQTEDGMFSLMEAECLASCGSGVTMRVGMDYYEHLTVPAVDALLHGFKSLSKELGGKSYEVHSGGPHTGPVKGFEPKMPQEPSAASAAPATTVAPDAATAKGEGA